MSFVAEKIAFARGEREVFSDISYKLDRGQALILKGANGAGKSTLLRLNANLMAPTAGRLLWNDRDINNDIDNHFRRICYLGHQEGIKKTLSIGENLKDWANVHSGQIDKILEALEFFDIRFLENVPVQYLSNGQRRRAALVRFAISDALIWLLDEPTVSLDESGVGKLAEIAHTHLERGGIIIMATHHAGFNLSSSTTLWL